MALFLHSGTQTREKEGETLSDKMVRLFLGVCGTSEGVARWARMPRVQYKGTTQVSKPTLPGWMMSTHTRPLDRFLDLALSPSGERAVLLDAALVEGALLRLRPRSDST